MKHTFFILTAAALAVSAETNNVPVSTNATPIVVSATRISKYRTEQNQSSMMPFAPEETPQVVDVITEDFIRDRNPTDLDNLLSYVPGVYTGGKTPMSRTAGKYTLRGMNGSESYLNGMMPLSAGLGTFLDPAVIQTVEIPKGPVGATVGGQTSTLGAYGAGGSIMIYQKRPVKDDFIVSEFRTTLGESLQRYRLTSDINTQIVTNKLMARLPFALNVEKPFWLPDGYKWGESWTLAPSLYGEIGDSVRVGIDSLIGYSDRPSYQGIALYDGKPAPGYDWDTDLSSKSMRARTTAFSVMPWIEWDATENLTLKTGAGIGWNSLTYDYIGPSSFVPGTPQNPAGVSKESGSVDSVYERYSIYQQGNYRLETGPVTQNFTLGNDYSTKIDTMRSSTPSTTTTLQKYGIYAQDALDLYGFRGVVGTRYDNFWSSSGNSGDTISPRAGLSYKITDWLIPFINVSRSSAPNFGYFSDTAQKHELTETWTADQWEGGFRIAPAKSFWITTSYFRIDQENAPISINPNNPNGPFVSEGESRSEGVEISATGNITKNWSVYTAYTFIKYTDISGGKEFDRFPANAASYYTTYKVDKLLGGTVFGFGYRYRDDFDATSRGSYQGPHYRVNSFDVFDASVEIPIPKNWYLGDASFSFAVKNIFNARYIESARNLQCFAGDPRTFELGIRSRF